MAGLFGIDSSDTAMEFTTATERKVTSSNRVCICVPRFAVFRSELAASSHRLISGPRSNLQAQPRSRIETRLKPSAAKLFEQPIGAIGQVRPSGAIAKQIPFTKDTLIGKLAAVSSIRGSQVHAQIQETEDITTFCDAFRCKSSWIRRIPSRSARS